FIFISGYQDWQFGPPDANGVRQVVIPANGTHFDCVSALNLASVCVRPNGDGSGVIDCNGTGGFSNYNTTVQQDHNSNQNSNDPGFHQPPDLTCSNSFTEPPPLSVVSNAKLETNNGACNGAGTPFACCTGNGTGTCDTNTPNNDCTANKVP